MSNTCQLPLGQLTTVGRIRRHNIGTIHCQVLSVVEIVRTQNESEWHPYYVNEREQNLTEPSKKYLYQYYIEHGSLMDRAD